MNHYHHGTTRRTGKATKMTMPKMPKMSGMTMPSMPRMHRDMTKLVDAAYANPRPRSRGH